MEITVTLEGLEDELRRIVRDEIQSAARQTDWLGHEDAARLLGVTPGHLYNLVSANRVPSHKVGGKRRYRRSELETHMESRA